MTIFRAGGFGLTIAAALLAAATSARAATLTNVTTQLQPNQHTRVLLQFDGVVVVTPNTTGATNYYVLVAPGSAVSPSLPQVIPVNTPSLTSVTLAVLPNGLNIGFATPGLVRPTLNRGAGIGTFIIDIPPSANGARAPTPGFNTPQYLNTPPPVAMGATQTKVVRLAYADVSEVVGVLVGGGNIAPAGVFNPQPSQIGQTPLFGSFQGGFPSGFQGYPQTGFNQFNNGFGLQQGYQQNAQGESLGQRINDNVAIDRRLNAIILTGTPQQIAQAESVIRQLDIPVQSVLLDTEVLEVTNSGAKALGLDYNQTTTSPIARIYDAQAAALNNIPSGAVAGSIAIQSNIFLLVSKGLARVLASPKILTQDGVPASILTGDSLPIRVTTPIGVGGVGAVSSQVEYINVGVNLQILPRVTTNRGVDANVFSQVSSVTGFTSSNDPQISTRQAQTKVSLVEGQTLVIGGLLQQRDIRNLQKIPIVGDLPLIGALFRFYTETRQDTNLIITITPHIIAPPTLNPPAQLGPTAAPVPGAAQPQK